MKRTLSIVALALAVIAPTLSAQKMGMSNNNAPTCTSAIAFGEKGSVEIKYTAITWGAGAWAKQITDPQRGERMRDRINKTAEAQPLGELKASADVTIGGKKVAAGTYKLYFTVDKDAKWTLVLAGKESKIEWLLDLKEGTENSRLGLALAAGKEDDTGEFTVQFGKMNCKIACSAGAAAEKKEAK